MWKPDPDYSFQLNLLRKAVRRKRARSFSFNVPKLRRYWPEYPHPAFFTALFVVFLSLTGSAIGAFAEVSPGSLPFLVTAAELTPERLKGLSTSRTRAIFGPPAFIRHEPPAEIWQYRSEICVLDLYVYAANNRQQVRFAELRPRAEPVSDPECLRDLASASH